MELLNVRGVGYRLATKTPAPAPPPGPPPIILGTTNVFSKNIAHVCCLQLVVWALRRW